jgi:hypothetical protein
MQVQPPKLIYLTIALPPVQNKDSMATISASAYDASEQRLRTNEIRLLTIISTGE